MARVANYCLFKIFAELWGTFEFRSFEIAKKLCQLCGKKSIYL